MTPSRSEIAAMSKKAARGAGYSWGQAEDAAAATVWLCRLGFDGCRALLVLLQTAPTPAQNPLTQGTMVVDQKELSQAAVTLCSPLFYLPFMAQLASVKEVHLTLTWDGGHFEIDEKQGLYGEANAPFETCCVTVGLTQNITQDPCKPKPRCAIDTGIWQGLTLFANKTYAPATEASRLAGAGAGTTDND